MSYHVNKQTHAHAQSFRRLFEAENAHSQNWSSPDSVASIQQPDEEA